MRSRVHRCEDQLDQQLETIARTLFRVTRIAVITLFFTSVMLVAFAAMAASTILVLISMPPLSCDNDKDVESVTVGSLSELASIDGFEDFANEKLESLPDCWCKP